MKIQVLSICKDQGKYKCDGKQNSKNQLTFCKHISVFLVTYIFYNNENKANN